MGLLLPVAVVLAAGASVACARGAGGARPGRSAFSGWPSACDDRAAGARLVGRVINDSGVPTPAAVQVALAGGPCGASVGDSGEYEVRHLRPGTYALIVSDGRYVQPSYVTVRIGRDSIYRRDVHVLPRLCADTLPRWALRGLVRDDSTGAAVSGAQVFLEGTFCGEITDAAGRFALYGVGPGAYDLVAQRIGYATARRTVRLPADSATALEFRLRPAAARLSH